MSYRIVSYRVVSCRVVSCRVVSHRVVSYRIVSYLVVSYRVVSCRVVIGVQIWTSVRRSADCVACSPTASIRREATRASAETALSATDTTAHVRYLFTYELTHVGPV